MLRIPCCVLDFFRCGAQGFSLWWLLLWQSMGSRACSFIQSFLKTQLKATFLSVACEVTVVQSCPTLCNPLDYIVHGILQARILELSSLSLFQHIFPTQGSNPDLPHCRQIFYQLSHKGSPRILE